MDAESTSTPSLKHHDALYFPDGDIVLSADVTKGISRSTILLRVHRFMLSHNSVIFRDMFSVPTNPEVNEVYDGVSVVRMSDNGEDLACLIGALYDLESLKLTRYDADVPLKMRGILLLANKYEIKSVCTRIVKHIEADWPKTLEEWYLQRCEFEKKIHFCDVQEGGWPGEPWEHQFPEPAAAIRIATDCNIPSILPAAYYRLAISEIERTWGVYEDDQETKQKQLSARWDLLEREDWKRWARGKHELFEMHKELEDVCFDQADDCEDETECSETRIALYQAHTQYETATFYQQPDIIWEIFRYLEKTGSTEFCQMCKRAVKDRLQKFLDAAWKKLPDIFRLSSVAQSE